MTAPAPSSAPYGPGTPKVRRFLVQLAGLGTDARQEVVARHAVSSHTAAYAAAETALGEAIERAGRTDARDALAGPLLQLVRRADAAEASDDDALATLDPIAEPALAALLALVAADLLSREVVALLYKPFDPVIPYSTL